MRAWIASGKEDWRRPFRVRAKNPAGRDHLRRCFTFNRAARRNAGALSMWLRGLHSVRIDRCGRAAADEKI